MDKKIPLVLFSILLTIGLSNAYALNPDYLGHRIVTSGDTIGGKTLSSFDAPLIQNNGVVLFRGSFSGGSGIFTQTSLVAASGDTIDGKTLTGVSVGAGVVGAPDMNDNGDVVFRGTFIGGSGIFTQTSLVAASGDTIDGKTLTGVDFPRINDNGDVVFRGSFSGGSGIFTPSSLLVQTGDTIGGKTLTNISSLGLQNNGVVLFRGSFSGGSGIFTPSSLLVQSGDTIDGVTFTDFGRVFNNDDGEIYFVGISSVGPGIFTPTSRIVGPIATMVLPEISDNGEWVLNREFTPLGNIGIFTPTGLVAAAGDTLDGVVTSSVVAASINNNGDVVFLGSNIQVGAIYLAFKPQTGSDLSCGPNTFESGEQCLPVSSLAFCGEKTIQVGSYCLPNILAICAEGTIADENLFMCFAQQMSSMIGGTLLDIDTTALLLASIGVNPVITGLAVVTLAGVAWQAVWFIHKKKKSSIS